MKENETYHGPENNMPVEPAGFCAPPQTHSPEQILKGNNLRAAMSTRDPTINIGSNQMHYNF